MEFSNMRASPMGIINSTKIYCLEIVLRALDNKCSRKRYFSLFLMVAVEENFRLDGRRILSYTEFFITIIRKFFMIFGNCHKRLKLAFYSIPHVCRGGKIFQQFSPLLSALFVLPVRVSCLFGKSNILLEIAFEFTFMDQEILKFLYGPHYSRVRLSFIFIECYWILIGTYYSPVNVCDEIRSNLQVTLRP